MFLPDRSVRRHLPTIVTCVVVVWLGAVCVYWAADAPASTRRAGPEELIEKVLDGRSRPQRFETRSRPVTIDVRATEASVSDITDGNDAPARDERRGPPGDKDKKKNVKTKTLPRDVGHSPPVAPRLTATLDLREPHHDYPALDLPLRSGTRVLAVTSGRVKATTKWGGCGKGVILRGKDNFTYTYCHGSKLLVGRGRHVREGQGLMRSGNTGDSTGPHLHLQIRRPNGKLVCPQDLLPAWSEGEPASPWDAKRVGCRAGANPGRKKSSQR